MIDCFNKILLSCIQFCKGQSHARGDDLASNDIVVDLNVICLLILAA